MVKTKQLVPNPAYDPGLGRGVSNQPMMWEFGTLERQLQAGDLVEFLCNGRGRGGHVRVFAKVTKVNQKTFKATEWNGSYAPGTSWTVNFESCFQPGAGGITLDLTKKD